ncbi:MAG: hypothetical protein FD136_1786 [Chitinophagaceae bacterium]|nr:MAG: hypothetical protein FD183_1427 [Chitinophagaceae bacterium]TXT29835.1 MAG: hypothetical protein FD136_1786 [Chitinophagaceae bacterium]
MKQVILCRAYGDFIIALETASRSILLENKHTLNDQHESLNDIQSLPEQYEGLPNNQTLDIQQIQCSEIKLVASMHLKPLYDAIPAEFKNPNIVIEFVDFGIKGSLLRAFTNKYLLHPSTLVQLNRLKKWLHQQPLHHTFILEQAYRKKILQWFTGKSFLHIAEGSNVYEQFERFFNAAPANVKSITESAAVNNTMLNVEMILGKQERSIAQDEINNKQRILILPVARMAFKHIPIAICKQIQAMHVLQGQTVQVAYFNNSIHGNQTLDEPIYYHNFNALVQLILSADLIYCPDSLAMHLAFLFRKPHIVLHPAKPAPGFLTPYALQHHSHFNFESFNLA